MRQERNPHPDAPGGAAPDPREKGAPRRRAGAAVESQGSAPSPPEPPVELLFAEASEALAVVAADNTLVRVNRRFEQWAGVESGKLVGRRRIDEFLTPEPPVRIATPTEEPLTLLGSSVTTSLFTFHGSDGGQFAVDASLGPLTDDLYLVSLRELDAERLTERRLYALWQLSGLLSASLDPESVVRALVEQVPELLDVRFLTVSLLDPESEQVLTVGEYSGAKEWAQVQLDRPVKRELSDLPELGRVLSDLQPVFLPHGKMLRLHEPETECQGGGIPGCALPSPAGEIMASEESGWALLLPMVVRGRLHGVLYLADTRPERVLSRIELSIATSLSAQAAAALENARRFRQEVHAHAEVAARYDADELILDNLNLGVFVIDPEGRVRFWNRTLEQLLEIPRASIQGQPLFDRVDQLMSHAEKVRQTARTRQPYVIDRLCRTTEGRGEVTESYRFQPLIREGRLTGILGILEDLTSRVRMDSRLVRSERLAAVGELAAGVAHNFNNILAAIGGDAQLLKLVAEEQQLPREVLESAELIYNETMRGGRIAHDLLSFARGQEPQLQMLDVRTVVSDAVRLVSNYPAARNITIEQAMDGHLPRVEADQNQLHQVFFNMILNAVQAMPSGGKLTIAARVHARQDDPEKGEVEVRFTDTGCGISREQLQRIFDPFYSRRPNGGTGTGLGLTVSLSMVRAMGGDIQIASAEGIGTTVQVILPIVERRTDGREAAARRGKILVVDDEPNVRRTLSLFLSRRGYQVHTAADGEEAVKHVEHALNTQPYDVVLMDLMLPKIDGVSAISMIAARDPSARIVVVTGITTPEKITEALECGALFSFTKPLPFPSLARVVDGLVAERREAPITG
jgi:PAS domain S-box-containing protein